MSAPWSTTMCTVASTPLAAVAHRVRGLGLGVSPRTNAGDRVGGVGVVRLVVGAGFVLAEDALHLFLDRGLELTADLGLVTGTVRPTCRRRRSSSGTRAAAWWRLRRAAGILDRGPRRDARVAQRHQPLLRDRQQLRFRARIDRRPHPRSAPPRAPTSALAYRPIGRGQLRQLLRGLDRARAPHPHRPRAHARPPRPRVCDPVCVSSTRSAACATIPSTTRRIEPNSSTTRTASAADNADASNASAISSNELGRQRVRRTCVRHRNNRV